MPGNTRVVRALALMALLSSVGVYAQADAVSSLVSDVEGIVSSALPDLSTPTQATSTQTTAPTSETSSSESSHTSDRTKSTDSSSPTNTATASDTGSATVTFSTSAGSSSVVGLLTGLPSIAGAGIPTMVIPFTANAPFMQKSTLPEGTVFIAVGACLAALGSCVLLWRLLVAWSINRSVKRAARAAMYIGPEKSSTWGGSTKSGGQYKEFESSSMSLDALTSAGKPIRSTRAPEETSRKSSAPPAGLFFSPTAQATNRASSANLESRGSSYLPAGYYATPSAADPAGGRSSVAIGSSLAPYARHSTVNPSPPSSPAPPHSRNTSDHSRSTSAHYNGPIHSSRDGLTRPSREGRRTASRDGFGPSREAMRSMSRDGYGSGREGSNLYVQQNSSSLLAGHSGGSEHLGGTRAPSAVLDELFENHGHGPRERF